MPALTPQQRSDEAQRWLHNGTQLDRNKQYVEAEECYTRAILLLRESIRDATLSQQEKQGLMNYISDVAKRVQLLRQMNRGSQSSRAPSTPASSQSSVATPANHSPARVQPVAHAPPDDYLSFLDEPKYKELMASTVEASRAPSRPSTASSSSSPAPSATRNGGAAARGAAKKTGAGPVPLAPPPPLPDDFLAMPAAVGADSGSRSGGGEPDGPPPPPGNDMLREHFAPRTSDFVLKAIDIAKQLTQQGELKRAVDVLQHAYRVGCRERNNPSNFGLIKETLHLMRQRYYKQNAPRFLQDNPLMPGEMEVLQKSGITNTILLPLWDDVKEGYGAENVFMPSEDVWEDSFTPQLDPKQVRRGAKLIHIADLSGAQLDKLAIIRHADPFSIRQSVVGDCSMVCSLILCASYQKRFPNAKIISNVIYPQDRDRNPFVNPKGKYCVKMLINGMTRIVTIDDRLPANPTSKELLCTQNTDPTELWVPLMEKAFVKVCGGSYNFPGSTSGSDLYKLSGWLPDTLKLRDADTDPDFQWARLSRGFANGAVLISIMTPTDMPKMLEDKLRLPSGHAYAVLDMREMEVEGKKLRVVYIRNPWSRQTWTGTLSIEDKSDAAKKVHEAFEYTPQHASLGAFLVLWEDAVQFFDRCSLSWNPYMLYRTPEGLPRRPTRLACHGTFTYATAMGELPQLHINVKAAPKPTRMHLVFSRHIQDVTEFSLQYEKDSPKTPFIGLQVFDVTAYPSVAQCIGGKCVLGMCHCRRLFSRSDVTAHLEPLNDTVYRNLSAFTVSFDCPAGTSCLLVVINRTESKVKDPFNFTLTLHTELDQMRLPMSDALKASESLTDFNNQVATTNADKGSSDHGVFMHFVPQTSLKYTTSTKGAWVKGKTCGGRSDSSTLVYNPQYKLTLAKPALLSAKLAVNGTTESCQLILCKKKPRSTGGAADQPLTFASRVDSLANDCDFVMSAKLYGNGGCCIDSALPETLTFDLHKVLGNRPKKQPRKLKVIVVDSSGKSSTTARGTDFFTMYNIDDTDEVSAVLMAALEEGYPVSLAKSVVMANGNQLPSSTCLREILHAGAEDEDCLDAEASCSARELQVRLILNNPLLETAGAFPFKKDSTEAQLFDEIKSAFHYLLHRSSQMRSYRAKFANFARRVSAASPPLSPDSVKIYLLELCSAGGDYVQRQLARESSTPNAPPAVPDCLPPLPAGEYTLVPSLWMKGVPGTFTLTVESTEQHAVSEVPPEGSGLRETVISAQLRPVGTALPGRPTNVRLLKKDDTYFLNSKASVQLSARGVFTCRLLLLEDAEEVERKGRAAAKTTYANVSIFRVHDTSVMQLVETSGAYTSVGGISIPPVVLDGSTVYLVVVSATESSSSKYVLRMYSSTTCTAQLTH